MDSEGGLRNPWVVVVGQKEIFKRGRKRLG
jgi:hypothetical protein